MDSPVHAHDLARRIMWHNSAPWTTTLIVESDYVVVANIIVVNMSPWPTRTNSREQAVAVKIPGNKSALCNCQFEGLPYVTTVLAQGLLHRGNCRLYLRLGLC
ncbi:hypothetical protein CRG98_033786 [Punica granatum]|uniref:Pectinesterase n=1 Tax=Punica granatum TaxID=22663 RepID=A0A2I0IP72_PUNGR|nr:hypothetical protein CRG98_033786 [Punica granatum]